MTEERKTIIADLARMTDLDFVETIYKAIEKRTHTSDTKAERGHFVLTNATLDVDEDIWETDHVGTHDSVHYEAGFVNDAPLCQFGHCGGCNSSLISWAKNAICPVCGASVYCT